MEPRRHEDTKEFNTGNRKFRRLRRFEIRFFLYLRHLRNLRFVFCISSCLRVFVVFLLVFVLHSAFIVLRLIKKIGRPPK